MKYNYEELGKLVERLQHGDEDVFEEIYYLTYKKIYFHTLAMIKDTYIAEDVVQDVFIIIKNNVNNLKNPKLFIAWINKITYNECLKVLKYQKKYNTINYEENLKEDKDLNDDKDPINYIEKREAKHNILKLINQLSDKHKSLILLKYYSGLTNEEISSTMELPLGSVKSGLHYAKKNLKSIAIKNKVYGVFLVPNLSFRLNQAADNMQTVNLIEKNSTSLKNYYKSLLMTISISTMALGISGMIGYVLLNNEPSIEKILYNKDYTNKSVEVDVYINKTRYLKDVYIMTSEGSRIDVNKIEEEKYEFNIKNNGKYTIYIDSIYGEKINKSIIIDNLDSKRPKIINYTYDEKELIIELEDEESKIDYDKIYITDFNERVINIKEKNEVENKIKLEIPKDKNNLTLFLFDKAANLSKYRISIEYRY